MAKVSCHLCDALTTPTKDGHYRQHGNPRCDASGTVVPLNDPAIPGVEEYAAQMAEAKSQVDDEWAMFLPPARTEKPGPVPMTELGKEVAARLREMFYAYINRDRSDNRSAQATMGPSEVGAACDRRLAMSLMRFPSVNPGSGWAAFKGTCIHVGLADMLQWASGNSGRYATEVRLQFPSPAVPFGTTDALDRIMLMVLDHKVMGSWSLDKLATKGPSPTYRVQAHVYAYGARQLGEDVRHVAIVGWPMERSDLDDLYVWTEPYDPAVARDALARADRLLADVTYKRDHLDDHEIPATFAFDNSDCRYCPFYKPNAPRTEGGYCNGKE